VEERVKDVVVVGGGIVGVSIAAELGHRGRSVVVLERSAGSGATGSSKGTARFRQLANYPDESFLDLGIRARELWGEVESGSGERILVPIGNLSIGDEANLLALANGLRSRGLPVEELDGADVPGRWPHMRAQAGGMLFQPDGEVIAADVAYRATVKIAESRGASIVRGAQVVGIDEQTDRVVISTGTESFETSRIVLAAGPWIRSIAALVDLELDVRVSCQTVAWFEMPDEVLARTPTVTDWSGREPYLLVDSGHGVKTAEHERGPEIAADEPGTIDAASIDRLHGFLSGLFFAPIPEAAETDTCLYTNAPGDQIVIESAGRVVAVSACSGQGFQYAPAVAELVSDALDAT
jgi:sarcosine oxidase